MLVRLVAAFERYLRLLIRDAIEEWSKKATNFERLPSGLASRNLVLSGRVISNSDLPREHIKVDLTDIVDNLLTCRRGSTVFKLNSLAFMTQVTGVTPEIIRNALKLVQVENWIDAVGDDAPLKTHLDCKRTADATKKIETKLKDLSRWRNNWAHGGDDEIALTCDDLLQSLRFLKLFGSALDRTVFKRIQAADLTRS